MQKTEKDFDEWNEKKKEIDFQKKRNIDIHIWEVYWYYQWMNIWYEQSKNKPFVRPCIILHTWLGKNKTLIAPLTTNITGSYQKFILHNSHKYNLKPSGVNFSDICVIDRKRLRSIYTFHVIPHKVINSLIDSYFSFLQKNRHLRS